MSNHHKVDSPEHLQTLLSADLTKLSLLYFRADWAEPCEQMDKVVLELVKRWDSILFLEIEAEALPDISESFEVDAVPYFILLRGHTLLTRLSGAQPSVLSAAITTHARPGPLSTTSQTPASGGGAYVASKEAEAANGGDEKEESDKDLEARCEKLMNQSDVVLFMKGDRETPRCGFSQKIVGILGTENVEYTTFDILTDDGVRQKLKKMNDWPTFPQLIVKGEFMGGLDVVQEMVESGELGDVLSA